MQTYAQHKYARISAQKTRLVADLIRNKKVDDAVSTLMFTSKKAANLVSKVLNSAIANAENNFGADIDELYVSEVQIDNGPTLKRMRARAKGRSNRILKRTCHITVKVSEERSKK